MVLTAVSHISDVTCRFSTVSPDIGDIVFHSYVRRMMVVHPYASQRLPNTNMFSLAVLTLFPVSPYLARERQRPRLSNNCIFW